MSDTIDITPVGLQTPDGEKRVNLAMQVVDSANALVADIATRMVDRLAANKQWLSEEHDTLKEAVERRKAAYEELLRAVAGKPKLYPANVNGERVMVTIPED